MFKKILSTLLVLILFCLFVAVMLPILIPVGAAYILCIAMQNIIDWGLDDV